MTTTKTKTVELVDISCGVCGIDFCVPDWFHRQRREDGKSFWCPAGHQIGYSKTEIDKLRDHVKQLEARTVHLNDQRLAAERSAAATRGQMTKLQKRIAGGVCPCCHRTFVNMTRHMASKHPDYAEATS